MTARSGRDPTQALVKLGMAAALIGAAAALRAGAPDVRAFRITGGPLDVAIMRFSEQADVQVLFDPRVAHGRTANPVVGRMTVAAALDRLLACTGLGSRFLGARTMTIEPARKTPTAQACAARPRGQSVPAGIPVQRRHS